MLTGDGVPDKWSWLCLWEGWGAWVPALVVVVAVVVIAAAPLPNSSALGFDQTFALVVVVVVAGTAAAGCCWAHATMFCVCTIWLCGCTALSSCFCCTGTDLFVAASVVAVAEISSLVGGSAVRVVGVVVVVAAAAAAVCS